MTGREAILNRVRAAIGAPEEARRNAVAERLKKARPGVIPARGQLPPRERVALFLSNLESVSATVELVKAPDGVPRAVAAYLRGRNLPAEFRMGADPRLASMPWDKQKALRILRGASDGFDDAGVSHAFGGVAETGTLVLASGAGNPTTINFLPENHIVVVAAADIACDIETVISRLRASYGKGTMPRTVNFVSGPSRSTDIGQKPILGAHGPRALHVIVVGSA